MKFTEKTYDDIKTMSYYTMLLYDATTTSVVKPFTTLSGTTHRRRVHLYTYMYVYIYIFIYLNRCTYRHLDWGRRGLKSGDGERYWGEKDQGTKGRSGYGYLGDAPGDRRGRMEDSGRYSGKKMKRLCCISRKNCFWTMLPEVMTAVLEKRCSAQTIYSLKA